MIRPGGPNSTHKPQNQKNTPRPLYTQPDPTPTPQNKKWHQPNPADKHKIETRRTQWEKEFIKFSKQTKKEVKKE